MRAANLFPVLCSMAMFGCVSAGTYNIDFENLSSVTTASPTPVPVNVGDRFQVGDVLIENQTQVRMYVLPFKWPGTNAGTGCPPSWTAGGYVEVVRDNMSGGSGNELHFNNASLGVVAPNTPPVREVRVRFGEYGGNINFIVNGTLHNPDNFDQVPPPPGVNLTVSPSPWTGPLGRLDLSGTIYNFNFTFPCPAGFPAQMYNTAFGGGQELWIDDLRLVVQP